MRRRTTSSKTSSETTPWHTSDRCTKQPSARSKRCRRSRSHLLKPARRSWPTISSSSEFMSHNVAIESENTELKATTARQELQIESLQAAARADRMKIDELKDARLQIEMLNHDLELRNRALEAVNKELESFSYAVSHDLRSPLRAIHGFSEALKQSARSKLSSEETAWLDKISAAADRLDRLTEDLLRLSRITRAQLKREPVDLAAIAREVIHELRQTEPRRDALFA